MIKTKCGKSLRMAHLGWLKCTEPPPGGQDILIICFPAYLGKMAREEFLMGGGRICL